MLCHGAALYIHCLCAFCHVMGAAGAKIISIGFSLALAGLRGKHPATDSLKVLVALSPEFLKEQARAAYFSHCLATPGACGAWARRARLCWTILSSAG